MSDFNTMWANAVNEMVSAIKSNNNILDFLLEYKPKENTGYIWSTDPQYKLYSDILDKKIISTSHSGASFAYCIREAVYKIRNEIVVVGQEVVTIDDSITILKSI